MPLYALNSDAVSGGNFFSSFGTSAAVASFFSTATFLLFNSSCVSFAGSADVFAVLVSAMVDENGCARNLHVGYTWICGVLGSTGYLNDGVQRAAVAILCRWRMEKGNMNEAGRISKMQKMTDSFASQPVRFVSSLTVFLYQLSLRFVAAVSLYTDVDGECQSGGIILVSTRGTKSVQRQNQPQLIKIYNILIITGFPNSKSGGD